MATKNTKMSEKAKLTFIRTQFVVEMEQQLSQNWSEGWNTNIKQTFGNL